MKITFKDVGQGDSIIIEWTDNDKNKIAIIDCKRNRKSNPVVSFLKEKGYKEIEFIIISHPHSDHYSGFIELLDFIEEDNITINAFGHTFQGIGKQYWEWFEVTSEETGQLDLIFKKAEKLRTETGLIKRFFAVVEDWSIPLSPTIEIRSVSPSHDEIHAYQIAVKLDSAINKKQASKAANYFSSIIYIKKDDQFILLTSDAEKETFSRIHNQHRFKGIKFSLCQAPHHGSYNNYLDLFWDNLSTRDKRDAVFSSGLNEQYKHPHLITVQSFEKNGYKLHPTNIVYGIQEYLNELNKKALILDTISDLDEDSLSGGDRIFSF